MTLQILMSRMRGALRLTTCATMLANALPATAQVARGDVAISPDGRWRALVRPDTGEAAANGDAPTSLWLEDRRSSALRLLIRSRPSEDARRDLTSLHGPVFSLDGGFVYVSSAAYATSSIVHQVNLATGRERFVVPGSIIGVLRNGPLRGFLVVEQHRYRRAGGSYDPIVIVRPDGFQRMVVPGASDGGERALRLWLRARGWRMT